MVRRTDVRSHDRACSPKELNNWSGRAREERPTASLNVLDVTGYRSVCRAPARQPSSQSEEDRTMEMRIDYVVVIAVTRLLAE